MSKTLRQTLKPGTFPTIRPMSLGNNRYARMHIPNRMPWYYEDGAYADLPPAVTGNLVIYDASGSTLVTIAPSTINASANYWCGLMYDGVDDCLYVIVNNVATSPDTYYLASIAPDGTVTPIGSGAQPSTDFSAAGSSMWVNGNYAYGSGSGLLNRAADGSGNLYLSCVYLSGWPTYAAQVMEFNVSTGAITDPVDYPSAGAGVRTLSGRHVYLSPDASSRAALNIYDANEFRYEVALPTASGFPVSYQGKLLQWNGMIAFASQDTSITSNYLRGARFFSASDFDVFIESLWEISQ